MASRFVSGGTIAGDDTSEDKGGRTEAGGNGHGERSGGNKNATEWEAVQKDLDEERRRREEARRANVEGGGGERSLYEVLQANKAAKQAAFEEQNRIRNQFRALDDDEIEFLHGVSDERRAEEERVRRETEEGLAGFRERQRATTAGGSEDAGVEDDGGNQEWGNAAAGRKRKREKEKEKGVLKGVKRRTSTGMKEKENGKGRDAAAAAAAGDDGLNPASTESTAPKDAAAVPTPARTANATQKPKPALGLVDYGSDDGDD